MKARPYREAAGLAAGLALVYAPALTAPVLYDDTSHVRDNPVFSLPFLDFWTGLISRDYFAFVRERTYQPFVTLFHYFTHASPLVYRSAGLVLHASNAALVFEIARRLTGRARTAALAALLFAAFPAHTEALNLSAFKGHPLAAFFSLAVVLAVMEACAGKGRLDPKLTAAAGCLLAFALLAKESGLVAVGLAATYIALFARARRLAPLAAVFAALTAGYLAFRFAWLAAPPAFPGSFARPTFESLAFYAKTLVLPLPLCLERSLPAGPLWLAWLAALAAAAWTLRKSREGLFCLAWIVLSLLPVLHLIPFANVSSVADRYLYLPAAGFCLLLAHLYGREARGERFLGVLLAAWTALTFARNLDYRSARALFEQTAACAPGNARAQFLDGNARFADKDYAGARAAYERVLALTDSSGAREALAELDRLEKKRN
ncbi:MAG: hypothetical protein HY923_05890 [Elusimicrobia bacterium]|nr:hypothetical protein [Elusimicrobiota bacterium]